MTISGSPATPVWVVPDEDLKKNGGAWAVLGQPAVPITGATAETINSEAAAAGEVLTADGSGGAAWLPGGGGGITLLEDPPIGSGWLVEVVADLTALTPGVATEVDISAHLTGAKIAFLLVAIYDITNPTLGGVELRPAPTSAPLPIVADLSQSFIGGIPVSLPVINDAFYVTVNDGGGATIVEGKIYLYGGM
jgi:hypothetical protein